MTDVMPADWLPTVAMKLIIGHWTAGGRAASDHDRRAYHVLVEGDGKVVRGIPSIAADSGGTKDGYAAHTLNCNTDSIGVSMCGIAGAVESPFNAGRAPLTKAQWDAFIRWRRVLASLAARKIVPLPALVKVVNLLMLGVAVTISLTWFPAAWRAFRRGGGEVEWQLIMAIVLTWAVLAMQRTWIIGVRWYEIPEGPFRQTVGGFMAYSLMVAGMLYIAAPGVTGGEVPSRNWIYILCATAGGALVAGFVIGAIATG